MEIKERLLHLQKAMSVYIDQATKLEEEHGIRFVGVPMMRPLHIYRGIEKLEALDGAVQKLKANEYDLGRVDKYITIDGWEYFQMGRSTGDVHFLEADKCK